MVLDTLREAVSLVVKRPVLWTAGAILALFAVTDILLQTSGDTFYAERIALLQVLVLPFVLGGIFGVIREEEWTLGTFWKMGMKYFFKILLPTLVILFAALLTVALLAVTLMVTGIGPAGAMITMIVAGVLLPFVMLTYFYDTVVVFEESGVFESIRRAIEFVMTRIFKVILFYLVNLGILLLLGVLFLVAWVALLYDKIEPLAGLDQAALQQIAPTDIIGMLGATGIMITAVCYALFILVATTVLYTYKACFFRRYAETLEVPVPGAGAYDEKGRWYKY